MRAWTLDKLDGLEGMKLGDVPDPAPAGGEVVLDVRYAALNPADYYLAQRQYPASPPLPHVLGRDGIGVVSVVGGVTGWNVGDVALILRSEIGVSRWGTLAERVAVPVESLVRPPAKWSEQESAAAPLVYLTAHQALTQWGELPTGANVLITGASGGVGVASIQLGAAAGHRMIGLSRSEAKRARLLALGASIVLDPEDQHWHKRLKEQLEPRRVDLAIDNIGGEQFARVIDVMGMHGLVSVVGQLAGPVPTFSTATLFFRRLRVGGVAVGTYAPAESQAAWRAVVEMLGRAGAKPVVDSVFPFERVQDAFARLKQGPMGKVLVGIHPSAE